MMAQKCVTSNIPRFETVNVPPWNSCGCNLPSRALAARDLTSFEIDSMPLRSALKTIGVMRPLSVETATETSTESNLKKMKYFKRKQKIIQGQTGDNLLSNDVA